jgi:vacuolar-type H+-ATPase subunit H
LYFIKKYLDRVQRLKDARSEAAKEIEELKAQKNTEYQNFVAQVKFEMFHDNCLLLFTPFF